GYSEAPHLDLKIYTTSDTSGKQGKNALCIYSDDQLATLTSSADSCKDEITGGKFSKANIRADCSRIEPEVYAQIAAFAVAEPKSEQAKEKTERSGRLRDSIVAKVNAYQDSISKYAAMAGIEEADLKAIMTHETVDIDPNAKSPSNPPALGLMQIVPKQNHDVCVRECGFSSKVDEQEYFNPDKNICCAAFIAKSKWREKPKKYGACCNKQGCVQEEREYVKREAMYRGYNGWGCGEWGDPNYVETLMSYYFFYGGNPSATYTPYKEQIGTYRVRPNFKTAYEYNLSVYDEVFQFVNDEILAKSNGTMVEEFLDEKMQAFNSTHTDLVMKRYCSDYPAAYQFAEEYVDCLLQEGDCVCNLLINIDLITIAYDLVLTNLSLQVRKAGGIASEYKIFFPEVFELLGYGQTQKDYFILSLDASGGNLEGTNAKEYFLEKKGDKLTLTRNWDASQLCKEKKEYYSLCVEDDSKIAHVSASFFSYAPVRMKFSIFLSQTISIESENPPSDSP
ncbi:MAG: transglycosylase SLT domain-containing protein, partial [Nanoarchaeota archaeon]